MKLCWFAPVVLMAGLGFGCANSPQSASPPPDLDTFRAALAESDELERTYLLTSFLRTLRSEDMPSVLAEVEQHRAGFDSDQVRLLMLGWTRFDGPAAFETAWNWPTPWKSILMEEAMHAWGYNDGPAALARCEQIEDVELQESLRQKVMAGWVSSRDRLGAAAYAATVSKPRRRTRLARRLAGEAMRDGPDAVIAWADAIPDDAPNDFKATAFSLGAGVVAKHDPARAAAWYERQMKHPYTSTALRTIASKWAQYHDPENLLEWMTALPVEPERELERADAVRTAYRIWAAEELEKAGAWLQSMPDGPARDAAIDEMARATVDESPRAALHWAVQIEDKDLLRKRTLRYTRRWFVEDPGAARAWIEAADLTPEVREHIEENLPSSSGRVSRNKANRAKRVTSGEQE